MLDRFARPSFGFAVTLALSWLALCALFFAAPGLDIAVARFFFTETACPAGAAAPCGGFAARIDPLWSAVRSAFHVAPAIIIGGLALWAAVAAVRGRAIRDAAQRLRLALVATFALGPGLLVNVLLKDHWGRPRPVDVDLFGGPLGFVRAGEWSSQCVDNCSFVSGEAAGVFFLPLVALLAPEPWRRPLFSALTALALAVAMLRVAFGAHWLSDALLGGLSSWVVFAAALAGLGRLAAAKAPQ